MINEKKDTDLFALVGPWSLPPSLFNNSVCKDVEKRTRAYQFCRSPRMGAPSSSMTTSSTVKKIAIFYRSVSLTFSWWTSFSMVHKMSRERVGSPCSAK
jgi:hypothetical protein